MKIKKINGFLAMLAISALMFTLTACEEEPGDPIDNPTPDPVTDLKGGQLNDTTLTIQWAHSPDQAQPWFVRYKVTITNDANSTVDTLSLPKTENSCNYVLNTSARGIKYNFAVVAVSDSGMASTPRTFSWALSRHFERNSNGDRYRVYVKASSDFGSGIQLYNPTTQLPEGGLLSNQGARWNLGLHTSTVSNAIDEIRFGSASELPNNQPANTPFPSVTPTDPAYITPVMEDSDNLYNMRNNDLTQGLDFGLRTIDLKGIANNHTQGAVFYARVGSGSSVHYAKVIVLKNGAGWLRGTFPNQYIELMISYQTAAGVPYAKIFAGK